MSAGFVLLEPSPDYKKVIHIYISKLKKKSVKYKVYFDFLALIIKLFTFESYILLATDPRAVKAIQVAMNEWEQMTCIRFKNRTTERNYAEFFKGSG